ncbi:MAG: Ig-like domain-containing protein [Chloroflexi bacterium]|nr:Ig-like domain-containing protein [Chloroflexota bacterium]
MRRFVFRRIALALLVAGLGWLLAAAVSLAQGGGGTVLELLPAPLGEVGQKLTLRARLTDGAGVPVPGAEVVFQRDASFMNYESELVLGRAVTDAQGIAVLLYSPRTEGETPVAALFRGNAQYAPASASGVLPVRGGPALYREEAGVRIPGVNVSLLVGVLGTVWSIYFIVVTLITLITREGAKELARIGGEP